MTDRPEVGVVIVAAGSGTRLGLNRPKAFVPVGDRSILEHSLHSVFGMRRPAQIVVVVPETERADAEAIVAASAGVVADLVSVVVGGESRQASVVAGLAVLAPAVATVLVHDAARSFTPAAQFEAVIDAVERTGGGVIPALPVTDTIKQTDASGVVVATVDRSTLAAVQTPQGFPRADLDAAYAVAGIEYTDDAAVFAAAGRTVLTVPGDVLAFKITTPWDLRRAEAIAAERAAAASVPAPSFRTGVGIDVHAFDADAPLWLGGLFWPDEPGLAGHSDGDALSHAICDALLSAAGLGDIGSRFGTDDARYVGAHGDVFLGGTVALLAGAGWAIGNVAVQVVARRPRLAARRAELEQHLTELVGAPVSVSATTTDGLGFTGRTEGVAVIATALVHPASTGLLARLDR